MALAMTFSVVTPSVAAAAELSEDGNNDVSSDSSQVVTQPEESVEIDSDAEASPATEETQEDSTEEEQGESAQNWEEEVQSDSGGESAQEEEVPEEAQPEELKTIKGALKGVDGARYTLTLSYDENAEIPDGAKLFLVELNLELTEEEKKRKENEKRPFETEKFLSEKALEQESFDLHRGLKVEENDYVLFTKFLDVSLEKDGKIIQPKAPVGITVETNAVKEGASDALEVAVYDKEATKEWEKKRELLIREQEKKIESGRVDREYAKRFEEKIFTPLELANETEKDKPKLFTAISELT
jgi:hypothetical protein